MLIVADKNIPYLKDTFEPFAKVVYLPANEINRESVFYADALLVRSVTKCDAQLLSGTSVKFIGSATTGDDHIDRQWCEDHNIVWYAAAGCNAGAVVQYTLSALFAFLYKRGYEHNKVTVGIVGAGRIGGQVERILQALSINTLVSDPPLFHQGRRSYGCSLEDLFTSTQVVTFHVPLTKTGAYPTWHMIDKDFHPDNFSVTGLINTSRGGVIATRWLEELTEAGNFYSMLDVFEDEENPPKNLIRNSWIATPHIAGYSVEGKIRATRMVGQALAKWAGWPEPVFTGMPEPEPLELSFHCSGDLVPDLYSIMKMVYDPHKDSVELKKNPSGLRDLRNHYLLRRENSAFVINCEGRPTNELISGLKQMGFEIKK
ncbi:MAG: 4-phosphoerythronate dehydrogenase PdxB [Bacteroidales bacterium]